MRYWAGGVTVRRDGMDCLLMNWWCDSLLQFLFLRPVAPFQRANLIHIPQHDRVIMLSISNPLRGPRLANSGRNRSPQPQSSSAHKRRVTRERSFCVSSTLELLNFPEAGSV